MGYYRGGRRAYPAYNHFRDLTSEQVRLLVFLAEGVEEFLKNDVNKGKSFSEVFADRLHPKVSAPHFNLPSGDSLDRIKEIKRELAAAITEYKGG